ncbi:hypothetical protein [Dyadobacter sp. 22481]|uniref:hypothetical protein n=1 Tax=Dyadobacter sp. 22481 TaxID=3453926 RepID=UPI003F8482C6
MENETWILIFNFSSLLFAVFAALSGYGITYFETAKQARKSNEAYPNSLMKYEVFRKISKRGKLYCQMATVMFGILVPISAFIASTLVDREAKIETLKKATSGTLSPGSRDQVRKIIKDGYAFVEIKIGNGVGRWFAGAADGVIFRIGDEIGLGVTEKSGNLLVSFIVRDKFGEIVAEMTENEWELNEENFYKRNYDDTGLEVIDSKGDVIFQIELEKGLIKLQGKLYTRSGGGAAFYCAPDGAAVIQGFDSTFVDSIHIQPIFKYPSEKYFGVRLTD